MSNPNLPKYVRDRYETGTRGFKSEKRQGIRRVLREIDEFRCGIAFAPNEAYTEFEKMVDSAERLKTLLSVDNWGR